MERLVILIPKELKEALANMAQADSRSMSQYVTLLIKKHIEWIETKRTTTKRQQLYHPGRD